eukprot:6368987-Alexandrium_andersonii.AAC.1
MPFSTAILQPHEEGLLQGNGMHLAQAGAVIVYVWGHLKRRGEEAVPRPLSSHSAAGSSVDGHDMGKEPCFGRNLNANATGSLVIVVFRNFLSVTPLGL